MNVLGYVQTFNLNFKIFQILQKLGDPHVKSFNYMIHKGLSQAIGNLIPVEFILNEKRIKITITNYTFSRPEVPMGTIGVKNNFVYPSECRQRAGTYKGKLYIDVAWYIDGMQQQSFQKDLGDIPVMIKVRKI